MRSCTPFLKPSEDKVCRVRGSISGQTPLSPYSHIVLRKQGRLWGKPKDGNRMTSYFLLKSTLSKVVILKSWGNLQKLINLIYS